MPNSWGRPPRYEIWQDLQALAFWILVIGVVGYLLFPNFFKDVYTRITDPLAITDSAELNSYSLPYDTAQVNSNVFPSLDYSTNINDALNGRNEVATGYWVIFVADGQFRQLSVNSESYSFLLKLIEKDQKADLKNTLILAANGQIKKYAVSDEIFSIINGLALIDARTKTT